MKKDRLAQTLGILLLPYLERDFGIEGKDVIQNIRHAFACLRKRGEEPEKGAGIKRERDKLRKAYEKAEKELTVFLRNLQELNPRSLDDFRMILNLYFPEEKIAALYDEYSACGMESPHNIDWFYFGNIFRIAGSLLTFRDGETAIRTWMNEKEEGYEDIFGYSDIFDKVEVWNLIGRKMVPDIFITAFYVESQLKEPHYLYGQTGRILLADKTLGKLLEKGIAETHFHLNAGLDYALLWEKATHPRFWEKVILTGEEYRKFVSRQKQELGFHVVVFRLALAYFLESSQYTCWSQMICSQTADPVVKELIFCLYQGRQPEYTERWVESYEKLMYQWEQKYGSSEDGDFLMNTVYCKYREYETYSEMVLLMKCMEYLREHQGETELLHLFLQYLREKNRFYSDVIQSGSIQGLEYFSITYGSMKNKLKKYIPDLNSRMEAIFKNMFHNIHLKKLEVRIAPPDPLQYDFTAENSSRKDLKNDILDSVGTVLSEYRKFIQKAQMHNISVPTLGIIFHFIKRDFVDNRIADTCWVTEKRLPSDTSHLLKWRRQMVKCAQAIEELRSEIPLLSEYIVGIDAASVENATEPWVFAPVYAAIRNRVITKPLLRNEESKIMKINNVGFTYHVGEEFRHILSGLRHVDEVIRFFFFKEGDRIGHAIALGEDVDRWIEENEVVVMPLIEYLEDLLWLWGLIVRERASFDVSMDVMEGKILELAKQAYGEIIGVTPNMLYEAYLEKFRLNNEAVFARMREQLLQTQQEEKWEHFCKYYDQNAVYGVLWTKEKILCTNFCPIYYQKLHAPIMVHVEKSIGHLLKEVQERVIRNVEQKGIYVEVNPTSNLVIGGAGSLRDNHIFQLNSRNLGSSGDGGHEVMVTVNSDDPMIFNTSSENELAYIYHAMNYRGYGKESVLEWVDKVRQFGMDSSFIKQEKSSEVLLEETKQLLKNMEFFRKKR